MSTKFDTPEEARGYLLALCEMDEKTANVVEVPDLKIAVMGDYLLEDPDAPEEIKERIRKRKAEQKGYKVDTPRGEVKFVIDLCSDGCCCWVVGACGCAIRL